MTRVPQACPVIKRAPELELLSLRAGSPAAYRVAVPLMRSSRAPERPAGCVEEWSGFRVGRQELGALTVARWPRFVVGERPNSVILDANLKDGLMIPLDTLLQY